MPGSFEFQLEDKIRLAWGGLATGLTGVVVTVYNADDGSVLLSNQTLAARGNGIYSYLWNHGRTVKTYCIAQYSYPALLGLGAGAMTDYFTIKDSNSLLDSGDGRAY